MAIMGKYQRELRDRRRDEERAQRRSELVGLGTPVSQTRVAPTINRSDYEGVRIGNSTSFAASPYQRTKDMLAAGYVQKMDINGNWRWTPGAAATPATTPATTPVSPTAAPDEDGTAWQAQQFGSPEFAEELARQDSPQGMTEEDKENQGDMKGGRSVHADEGGGGSRTYGPEGDPWALSDEEQARYESIRASGKYKDDEVMRLRAMIDSRGVDYVRDRARALRHARDVEIAGDLAERFNMDNPGTKPSTWQDFYQAVTPEMLTGLADALPGEGGRNGRERFVNKINAGIADAVASGDADRILAERRKAMFLAKRLGFRYYAESTGSENVPGLGALRADPGGWLPAGDAPRSYFRPTADGAVQQRWRIDADPDDPRVRADPGRYYGQLRALRRHGWSPTYTDGGKGEPMYHEGDLVGTGRPGVHLLYDGATKFGLRLTKADRDALAETGIGYGRAQSRKSQHVSRRTAAKARALLEEYDKAKGRTGDGR